MRLKEMFLTLLIASMPSGLTRVSDYFGIQTQTVLTQQKAGEKQIPSSPTKPQSTIKQLTEKEIQQAFVQVESVDEGQLEALPAKELAVEQEQELSTDQPSSDNESISTLRATPNTSSIVRGVSSKDGLWAQTVDYTHKPFPRTVGDFSFSPEATYYDLIHPEHFNHIIGMCEVKQDTTTGEYKFTFLAFRKVDGQQGWGPSPYGRTYLGNKINLPKYFGSLVNKIRATDTKKIESGDIPQASEMSQHGGRKDKKHIDHKKGSKDHHKFAHNYHKKPYYNKVA